MQTESSVAQPFRRRLSPSTVNRLWEYQGYGVLLFMFLCFFPRLAHIGEYFFLSLVAVALPLVVRDRARIHWSTGLETPLLLFITWVLISVPFAIDPAYSFGEWRKLVIKVLAFYWVFTVLQFQSLRTFLPRFLVVIQVATATICMVALVEFVLRGGGWTDRTVRAGALFSDYNWLSTYLVMAIPLVAVAAAMPHTIARRLLGIAIVFLAMLGQAFSYTRAGWLGLFVEGLAFGLLARQRRLIAILLAFAILLGAILLTASHFGYQRSTVDPWTLEARLGVWKLQLRETIEHPLVGIGYGGYTFMKRFAGYPEAAKADGPHSAFLMVAMGSGLPAVAFLLWTLTAAVRRLISIGRSIASPEHAPVVLAIAVMIFGFATRNVFDYMFAGSLAYLFWIMVAVGLQSGSVGRRLQNSAR